MSSLPASGPVLLRPMWLLLGTRQQCLYNRTQKGWVCQAGGPLSSSEGLEGRQQRLECPEWWLVCGCGHAGGDRGLSCRTCSSGLGLGAVSVEVMLGG
jgi:hypothetical protein